MIDPGELLFAKVLMPDFLAGRGPTKWDFRDPEGVAAKVADGLKAYLRGKAEPPAEIDTRWAFDLPTEVPESAAASTERLPDDVVIGFSMTAQNALTYLRDLIPERPIVGLVKRRAVMNHAERATVRRAAAAIEDPIGRLASPELLSQDGVAAIAAVYPSLYSELLLMVGEAIQALGRPLRAREEAALSKLIGAPVQSLGVLKGPDQTQAGTDPNPRRPRGTPPKEPEIQTSTQRVANR